MRIAIIGAGNVGSALASAAARAGHDVTVTARTIEHARAVARDTGARATESNAASAAAADIIILAVPYASAAHALAEIRDVVAGKTLIDVTNPLTADYAGLATDGISAAEELQQQAPEVHVVKAFNTIFATHQANPSREIDGFVAADDVKAKQQVMSLVDSIGFAPLDVGPLSSARMLEGMAFLNIGLNAQNGWSWTSTWKLER